jgi:hypothetical protein
MTTPNPATAATRIAIEFLTLWLEDNRQAAAEHMYDVLHDPASPQVEALIAGLLNLSMLFAFEAAKANGAAPDRYVAWVGDWLGRHSPQLPE